MAQSQPEPTPRSAPLPSGLVAFVKRDCPTCVQVAPVLAELARKTQLTVYTQDDPAFPPGLPSDAKLVDDRDLDVSWQNTIEAVPTLLRVEQGRELERAVGWQREEWEALSGVRGLGASLPAWRPGCGSLSVDPVRAHELLLRHGATKLRARRVELAALEDEVEACFDRGWSDGLPVVPPTASRVLRMLAGTSRAPDEIVAVVPPDLVPCTVEKVAINAVLAGCKPEYLPVVLTAVEMACTPQFNAHGVLATTMSVGPVLVVNGPIRRAIGMNSGINVFGQGNRANGTIGRALQLVIRNVGGGRPGEVDRATLGNPGKLGFCFAEDEEGSPWAPLSTDFGFESGQNVLTIFPGEGPRTLVDQMARTADEVAATFAYHLRAMLSPKAVMAFDAMLVVSPDHSRVFRAAGWTRKQVRERLLELTTMSGDDLVRGALGVAEGLPESVRGRRIPKFRENGIHIVHAGGGAGLFSAIIPGWANGELGSQTLAREIQT